MIVVKGGEAAALGLDNVALVWTAAGVAQGQTGWLGYFHEVDTRGRLCSAGAQAVRRQMRPMRHAEKGCSDNLLVSYSFVVCASKYRYPLETASQLSER